MKSGLHSERRAAVFSDRRGWVHRYLNGRYRHVNGSFPTFNIRIRPRGAIARLYYPKKITISDEKKSILTIRQGHPAYNDQQMRTAGSRGPATLENYHFLERYR